MKRKEFLSLGSLATLGLVLGQSPLKGSGFLAFGDSQGTFLPVGGSSEIYVNRGGTVGLFESKDGYVVVDSQFPQTISEVLLKINKTEKPVLYLANTHHHGDHTSGNYLFKDLSKGLVAHRTVPESQRTSAAKAGTLDKQKYANLLFETEFQFDLTDQVMKGYHFGAGHTRGDVVYHFESDNVVHMGDLLFKDMIPVFRSADGASIQGWIDCLERATEKFDSETKFIFGHAPSGMQSIGTKGDLSEMKNFLDSAGNFVSKAIRDHVSTKVLLEKHSFVPGFENRLTPARFKGFLEEVRITLTP